MKSRIRGLRAGTRRLYRRVRVLWRALPRVRWQMFEFRRNEDLQGDRTPIQVCPRGCDYHKQARRELVARTRLSGRAATHVAYSFETTNCPKCGARLARSCVRCHRDIVTPLADLCHFCGLPQPWASERRAGVERASLLRWREGEEQANAPADQLYTANEHGGVWVIEGDVSQLNVDTVISDDDVDGQMWAQVARAIKLAAGEGVERLAQEGKPFKLGHAWWTSAGAIQQMQGIVHVASMNRNGEAKVEAMRECLAAAFELAGEHQCESIGVAAIGSGPASISLSQWSRVFSDVAVEHLDLLACKRRAEAEEAPPPLSIVLVLFEPPDFAADRALLERAFWYAWAKAGRPRTGEPKVELGRFRRRELTVRAELARRHTAYEVPLGGSGDVAENTNGSSEVPDRAETPDQAGPSVTNRRP